MSVPHLPDPAHTHQPASLAEGIELTGLPDPNDTAFHPPTSTKPPQVSWWRRHIAPIVPFTDCRDHLALERTFLAYIRTANAVALFGVAAAQLFRLDAKTSPNQVSTFFRLGRPLGAAAEAIAILIVLVGAVPCWRQQCRLVTGHVKVGPGWEIWVVIAAMSVYLLIALVLNAGDTAADAAEN